MPNYLQRIAAAGARLTSAPMPSAVGGPSLPPSVTISPDMPVEAWEPPDRPSPAPAEQFSSTLTAVAPESLVPHPVARPPDPALPEEPPMPVRTARATQPPAYGSESVANPTPPAGEPAPVAAESVLPHEEVHPSYSAPQAAAPIPAARTALLGPSLDAVAGAPPTTVVRLPRAMRSSGAQPAEAAPADRAVEPSTPQLAPSPSTETFDLAAPPAKWAPDSAVLLQNVAPPRRPPESPDQPEGASPGTSPSPPRGASLTPAPADRPTTLPTTTFLAALRPPAASTAPSPPPSPAMVGFPPHTPADRSERSRITIGQVAVEVHNVIPAPSPAKPAEVRTPSVDPLEARFLGRLRWKL